MTAVPEDDDAADDENDELFIDEPPAADDFCLLCTFPPPSVRNGDAAVIGERERDRVERLSPPPPRRASGDRERERDRDLFDDLDDLPECLSSRSRSRRLLLSRSLSRRERSRLVERERLLFRTMITFFIIL